MLSVHVLPTKIDHDFLYIENPLRLDFNLNDAFSHNSVHIFLQCFTYQYYMASSELSLSLQCAAFMHTCFNIFMNTSP